MVSRRICLLVTLGLLAVFAPRSGGENTGNAAEVATNGKAHSSLLNASPAAIASATRQSSTAGGETGFHAAIDGLTASPWAAATLGPLDGLQRELLSVFVLLASVLAAMVITGRIRRADPPADGESYSRADIPPLSRDTPPATRGSGN